VSAIKSLHSRTFERLMHEYEQSLISSVTAGIPNSYAEYRQMVGELAGLANALRISELADYELSGDEPNVST